MKPDYVLVRSTYFLKNALHTVYGIAMVHQDGDDITITKTFTDLSIQKEKTMKLVEKCRSVMLDPIHIKDVIDDFLIE